MLTTVHCHQLNVRGLKRTYRLVHATGLALIVLTGLRAQLAPAPYLILSAWLILCLTPLCCLWTLTWAEVVLIRKLI
jgi:hypothetical protein